MTSSRRYFQTFLSVALAIFAAVGLLNFWIDPYAVFGRSPIPGFNDVKMGNNERMEQAFMLRQSAAHTLILGNSRALAFETDHPRLAGVVTSKVVLVGTNIWEIEELFRHATIVAPIRRLIVLVDFVNFNANLRVPDRDAPYLEDDDEGLDLDPLDGRAPALLSFDALSASLRTIRASRDGGSSAIPALTRATRAKFIDVTRRSARIGGHYTPAPSNAYAFATDCADCSSFDALARILRRAHRLDIDTRLVMSPSHAWQWQTIYSLGYWETWQSWKRNVVMTNERVADELDRSAFPIWDFSGFNDVTTEEVPSPLEPQRQMRYYRDPSHYTRSIADRVLDRVLAVGTDVRIPDDFGVRLDLENVESKIEEDRRGLSEWRRAHPEDVREIDRAVG